jgi:hypothetical protein
LKKRETIAFVEIHDFHIIRALQESYAASDNFLNSVNIANGAIKDNATVD